MDQYQLIQDRVPWHRHPPDSRRRHEAAPSWAGCPAHWRASFKTFARRFQRNLLSNLYQNFRSQPRLRRMQNAMVKEMDPKASRARRGALAGAGGLVECLSSSRTASTKPRPSRR